MNTNMNLFSGFNGLHSLESVVGLVSASLIIKLIERCTDKFCKENTDLHDALHVVEDAIEKEIDEQIPDSQLLDCISECPTVFHSPQNREEKDLETTSTVYNLPVHPTGLVAKPIVTTVIDPNRYVLTRANCQALG